MKWLKRVLVALAILILAVGVYGFFLVRRSFPTVDGELIVAGLSAPVTVIRDVDGIPHIYASNSRDMYMAQGFVEAQDRFWQMDFWRHIGAGRLSEMFGESQVKTDMFLRSLGFTDLVEAELEMMDPAVRQILEWYADGVNAYLQDRDASEISLEYAVLGLTNRSYEIEPWSPVHTMTWTKVMSWDLSANLSSEIERAILSAQLPVDRVEQLWPPYPEEHPVIVPSDLVVAKAVPPDLPDSSTAALRTVAAAVDSLEGLTGGGFEGIGSNSWAVSGSLSETGHPLLANDPHLAIQMPSIWYAVGLHCTDDGPQCGQDRIGFSFAGAPGIVLGHNEHIAWGVTTQPADTQDLFIEKVNPDNPSQYEVDGEWAEMEMSTETIVVAGQPDRELTVRRTRHGPVISGIFIEEGAFDDSAVETSDEYVVALAWQTLQPSTLIEAIVGINEATTYEEFREAASMWDIATQNLSYADTEGNIAYQSTGEIPVRANGDGRWPVPGWTSEYEWTGLVAFEDLPAILNPERGYVASANQPVTRSGEGPFEMYDAAYGYRASRVEEMIEGGSHSIDTFQTAQMDSWDGGAETLVPFILDVEAPNENSAELQDLIAAWSSSDEPFQATADSAGAAAYQGVWRHVLAITFHDELPEEYEPVGGSRWFEVIAHLVNEPNDPWWDDVTTEQIETRDDVLAEALAHANIELTNRLGSNRGNWTWGRLHIANFENQTLGRSGIAPIEWLFNRSAPKRVGGGPSIVNAAGWDANESFLVDWIPSFRMVIDLGDLSRSTAINATGQSGHAFHSHYDDMIEPWTEGVQVSLRWTDEPVAAAARATLTLSPAS